MKNTNSSARIPPPIDLPHILTTLSTVRSHFHSLQTSTTNNEETMEAHKLQMKHQILLTYLAANSDLTREDVKLDVAQEKKGEEERRRRIGHTRRRRRGREKEGSVRTSSRDTSRNNRDGITTNNTYGEEGGGTNYHGSHGGSQRLQDIKNNNDTNPNGAVELFSQSRTASFGKQALAAHDMARKTSEYTKSQRNKRRIRWGEEKGEKEVEEVELRVLLEKRKERVERRRRRLLGIVEVANSKCSNGGGVDGDEEGLEDEVDGANDSTSVVKRKLGTNRSTRLRRMKSIKSAKQQLNSARINLSRKRRHVSFQCEEENGADESSATTYLNDTIPKNAAYGDDMNSNNHHQKQKPNTSSSKLPPIPNQPDTNTTIKPITQLTTTTATTATAASIIACPICHQTLTLPEQYQPHDGDRFLSEHIQICQEDIGDDHGKPTTSLSATTSHNSSSSIFSRRALRSSARIRTSTRSSIPITYTEKEEDDVEEEEDDETETETEEEDMRTRSIKRSTVTTDRTRSKTTNDLTPPVAKNTVLVIVSWVIGLMVVFVSGWLGMGGMV